MLKLDEGIVWSIVKLLGLSRGHDVLNLGHLADHDSFDRDNAANTTHKPPVIRKAVLVLSLCSRVQCY